MAGCREHARRAVISADNPPAHRVIEHEHPAGARHLGNQPLGLGVVDRAHLLFVEEIPHGATVAKKFEALPVDEISPRSGADHGSARDASRR